MEELGRRIDKVDLFIRLEAKNSTLRYTAVVRDRGVEVD